MKTVEEPLFRSYVFVRVNESDYSRVRRTDGVLNFVYWNGRPAVVKDREIETIKKFMNEFENVLAIPLSIEPNQRVRVESGLLMNNEGVVLKVLHRKVQVVIESLGYALVATVDKKNVQPV